MSASRIHNLQLEESSEEEKKSLSTIVSSTSHDHGNESFQNFFNETGGKRDTIDVRQAQSQADTEFLNFLRASNPGAYVIDQQHQVSNSGDSYQNEDTLRAGNNSSKEHARINSSLSDLFTAPTAMGMGMPITSAPSKDTIHSTSTQASPPSGPDLFLPGSRPPTSVQSSSLGAPAANTLSKPDAMHKRDRSVSFDTEVIFHRLAAATAPSQRPSDTSNYQSSTMARPSLERAVSVNFGQLARRGLASQVPPRSAGMAHQRKLTVEDLLDKGNYETEAETTILKAFEQQQREHHHRFQSETSTILSGVPDEVGHDLDGIDGVNSARSDETPSSTPGRNQADNDTQDNNSSTPVPSSLSRIRSHRPALQRDESRNNVYRQSRHHKTMSVEDQLAGLSHAMWAMEECKDKPAHTRERRTASGDSHFSKSAQLLSSHDAPSSSPGCGRRERLNSSASHTGAPLLPHLPALDETEEARSSDEPLEASEGDENDPNGNLLLNEEDDTEDLEAQGQRQRSGGRKISPLKKQQRQRSTAGSKVIQGTADKLREDLDVWRSFFRPRRKHMMAYARRSMCYIYMPFVGIAAILFYFSDNPPTGVMEEEDGDENITDIPIYQASASWWLLFVVRQLVTMSLALLLQIVVIDFLCIGTKFMLRVLGPLLTLLLVQAKGWPFVVFCWSCLDFGLLYGDNAFAHHWGYFQDVVGLFNDSNPSGTVVSSDWNRRILLIGVTVSIFVALKRFALGLFLGRQTFHHYGENLAKVMNKMVLIGEVAQLAKRISKRYDLLQRGLLEDFAGLGKKIQTIRELTMSFGDDQDGDDNASGSFSTANKTAGTERLVDTGRRDPLTGSLLPEEKAKLMKLIDRWEEPDRRTTKLNRVSIASVLKFRNALTLIRNDFPFTFAFGLADSRESCIDSAQEVYNRLLLASNGENDTSPRMVHFETLALIALDENVSIDQGKAKELIRVFRPDRDGALSILDFTKSIDAVYKEFRLLQASIANSSQIDHAFENIVNIIFYVIVVAIIMSQLGFDPLSLFLSLSSIILAFAFMIGSASSKYFEGLLFILIRRPYGIGDIIHISNIESNTNVDGSIGWVVQHVSLFTTTVQWLSTQEVASLSNGSLANSRVINWARSFNTRFMIIFVIPIEAKYETLEIFKKAVEEYMKLRPREWLAFNAFRVIGVWADQGYMKIEVVVQHREAWQNIGTVLDSRGNLISYCHEVQKILGLEYRRPPLPVEMRTDGNSVSANASQILHQFQNLNHGPPPSSSYSKKEETDQMEHGTLQQQNLARAAESLQLSQDDLHDDCATRSHTQNMSDLFRSAAQERHQMTVQR